MTDITVTAIHIPYPNAENPDIINGQPYTVPRYTVTINNLDGNEGQTIGGSMLYYNMGIKLLNIAGLDARAARKVMNDADLAALIRKINPGTQS